MGFTSRIADAGTAQQHLAERCRGDCCQRLPCRMFKAGYERGYEDGRGAGYASGYSDGYSAGHGDGYSAGAASAGGTR